MLEGASLAESSGIDSSLHSHSCEAEPLLFLWESNSALTRHLISGPGLIHTHLTTPCRDQGQTCGPGRCVAPCLPIHRQSAVGRDHPGPYPCFQSVPAAVVPSHQSHSVWQHTHHLTPGSGIGCKWCIRKIHEMAGSSQGLRSPDTIIMDSILPLPPTSF